MGDIMFDNDYVITFFLVLYVRRKNNILRHGLTMLANFYKMFHFDRLPINDFICFFLFQDHKTLNYGSKYSLKIFI